MSYAPPYNSATADGIKKQFTFGFELPEASDLKLYSIL